MEGIDIKNGRDEDIPCIIEPNKTKRLSEEAGCGDNICNFLECCFLIFTILTTFQSEIIKNLQNFNLTCGTSIGGRSWSTRPLFTVD